MAQGTTPQQGGLAPRPARVDPAIRHVRHNSRAVQHEASIYATPTARRDVVQNARDGELLCATDKSQSVAGRYERATGGLAGVSCQGSNRQASASVSAVSRRGTCGSVIGRLRMHLLGHMHWRTRVSRLQIGVAVAVMLKLLT